MRRDDVKERKIQSLRSLREEMKAVARGERPAPLDAGRPSFNFARPSPRGGEGRSRRAPEKIDRGNGTNQVQEGHSSNPHQERLDFIEPNPASRAGGGEPHRRPNGREIDQYRSTVTRRRFRLSG